MERGRERGRDGGKEGVNVEGKMNVRTEGSDAGREGGRERKGQRDEGVKKEGWMDRQKGVM